MNDYETDLDPQLNERGPAGTNAGPRQVHQAPEDLFVVRPDGSLVQYRAGDAMQPEHVELPRLKAVRDASGALQPEHVPEKPARRSRPKLETKARS